jgi:hypothetical protein
MEINIKVCLTTSLGRSEVMRNIIFLLKGYTQEIRSFSLIDIHIPIPRI